MPNSLATLTLRERAALARGVRAAEPDRDLLARWNALPPFRDPAILDLRLAAAGLSRASFEIALGLGAAPIGAPPSGRPDILADLAMARRRHPDWRATLAGLTPRNAEGLDGFPLLVGPLLVASLRRLEAACEAAARTAPLAPAPVARSAVEFLCGRVARMAQRCLLVALARTRDSGGLAGTTPQARFSAFLDLLAEPDFADGVLAEFPVLGRQLGLAVAQAESATLELIDRYRQDWREIFEELAPHRGPEMLGSLTLEAGDPHHDGCTVAFLHFESGLKAVYKPRPPGIDLAFSGLLRWLDDRGFPEKLEAPRMLDRGDHGWAEFIEPAACGSRADIDAFYRRQGALLAVLHILGGTDFHHENLIARGACPVPVDLETLLQPDPGLCGLVRGVAPPGSSVYETVRNVGLLPTRIWGREGEAGIDMSGIGGGGGMSPVAGLVPEHVGTDRMRLVRKPVAVPPARHWPTLDGRPIALEEHVDAIVAGFADACDFLSRHRRELLAPDGPLAPFAEVEARVILRPTYYYALLQMDAFHPRVLADGLERDLYYDRLWMHGAHNRLPSRAIEAERLALWRNDIPRFTFRPGRRELLADTGGVIDDHFPRTAFESLERRMRAFDAAAIGRQRWLVEKTLDLAVLHRQPAVHPQVAVPRDRDPLPARAFLDRAKAIADRLADLAFPAEDGSLTWLTCLPAGIGSWQYRQAGHDLYNGLPGIALFLATAGAVLGEERYTDIARRAWATLGSFLGAGHPVPIGPGGYDGWGGLLLAAHRMAATLGEPSLAGSMVRRLPSPSELVANDRSFDLVSGAAGFLACAIPLLDDGVDLAGHCAACGDHLLRHAVETGNGLGWQLGVAGASPLGGYSHGAAGIARSLLLLARQAGEERFHEAALGALAYDRSLFCPEEGNWLDLREGPRPGEENGGEHHFVVAWCHGAPGIALGRLLIRDLLSDAACDGEIDLAVAKTLADGFGRNHSLCHGDLGNLDILMTVARARRDRALAGKCARLAAGIVACADRDGWRLGYAPSLEPLGLMTGLAGIGHGLLRLAAPDRVPSVLTFEAPTRRPRASRPAGEAFRDRPAGGRSRTVRGCRRAWRRSR